LISELVEVDVGELERMIIADRRVTDSLTIVGYSRAKLDGILGG
jgi:hypothetical protein